MDVTTGNMASVFLQLSQGIDVGNPSYSKTSYYSFTFDYVNENSGQCYVMAVDFNTGNSGIFAGPLSVK